MKLPTIPRKKPWKEKQVESKNHILCLAILLKQGSQFGQTVPALGRNTVRAPDRKAKTWQRPEKKQYALRVFPPRKMMTIILHPGIEDGGKDFRADSARTGGL